MRSSEGACPESLTEMGRNVCYLEGSKRAFMAIAHNSFFMCLLDGYVFAPFKLPRSCVRVAGFISYPWNSLRCDV